MNKCNIELRHWDDKRQHSVVYINDKRISLEIAYFSPFHKAVYVKI